MRTADALLPALLLSACAGPEQAARAVIPVTVMVAEPGAFSVAVTAPVILEAEDEAVLQVSIPGRVTAVHVSVGDTVMTGELLVSMITDRAHQAGLSASVAALSAARARDSYAAGELRRAAALLQSGSATPSDYERALAGASAAAAALEAARAAHAGALDGMSRGTLTAPFPGTVTRVWAREGNQAAGPLVALSGQGALRCRALLSQDALPGLTPGLPAFFSTSHHPGVSFPGTVRTCGSAVDPATGLVPVTVSISDPMQELLPGMSGMISISVGSEDSVVSLPRNAFVNMPDGSLRVMLVRGGRAFPVTPETGSESGFNTAVLSGVSPGDSVVLLGNRILAPGDTVKVVEK